MPVLKLNIGLNINGVQALKLEPTLKAIKDHLKPIIAGQSRYTVEQAKSGEFTICAAVIVSRMTKGELDHLIDIMCAEFEQDCIAGIYDNAGFLIGPRCEDYGGCFNINYWLEPANLPAHALELMELIDCFDAVVECAAEWPYNEKEAKRQINRVSIIRSNLKARQG